MGAAVFFVKQEAIAYLWIFFLSYFHYHDFFLSFRFLFPKHSAIYGEAESSAYIGPKQPTTIYHSNSKCQPDS